MRNIYNLTKGKVEVYEIEPIVRNVISFRKDQMDSIPEDERVLEVLPNRSWFNPTKGVVYECGSYLLRKKIPNDRDNFILREFINGHVTKYDLYEKTRTDNDEPLLVIDPILYMEERRIQITRDILIELLLEKEDYEGLASMDADYSNVRELFRITNDPVSVIDLEELKKYFSTSLVPFNEMSTQMSKIGNSTKVYRKLR